jgi:hypothetical protein
MPDSGPGQRAVAGRDMVLPGMGRMPRISAVAEWPECRGLSMSNPSALSGCRLFDTLRCRQHFYPGSRFGLPGSGDSYVARLIGCIR